MGNPEKLPTPLTSVLKSFSADGEAEQELRLKWKMEEEEKEGKEKANLPCMTEPAASAVVGEEGTGEEKWNKSQRALPHLACTPCKGHLSFFVFCPCCQKNKAKPFISYYSPHSLKGTGSHLEAPQVGWLVF